MVKLDLSACTVFLVLFKPRSCGALSHINYPNHLYLVLYRLPPGGLFSEATFDLTTVSSESQTPCLLSTWHFLLF